jgi:hypothetical protein
MRPTPLPCALAAACVFLVLAAPGCDEASPVAPPGTTLSVTATPSQIGANGTSTIRVTALKSNGTPVNPGTEVRLATTLGTIDEIVETDSSGVAEGTLRGNGRIGMATVTARTGSAEPATVDVEIGEFANNITLQATPSQVGPGGTVSLLALVRDDEGRPLQGAGVNFQTELGTLDSRGAIRNTHANGQASDTLRVSAEDIEASPSPSFSVTATVGNEGGTASDTATIRILTLEPAIRFFPTAASGNMVFFRNETSGSEPIAFDWDFQNDGTVDSMLREPTFNYGNPGMVTVRLDAENTAGTDTAFCTFAVPVSGNPVCESQ